MKFYNPKDEDFKEVLSYINPDKFLKRMLKTNELNKITENYGEDVYNLCHNSVAYILTQLQNTYFIYQIKIAKGTFHNKDHSWIIAGEYFIDLTLAQFIKCPRLAITKKQEVEGYGINSIESPEVYINKLKTEYNI